MKVVLIPCGSTEWDEEGRILGRVELPLTSAGQEQCRAWARQLGELGLRRIFHGPDELTTQTASLLARMLSIRTKRIDDLVEVDVGLWTGLTAEQLKTRYASAHRQLREAPLNVSPPGGESLAAAARRLSDCLGKQLRKNNKGAVGLVMRPFSFALARCIVEGRGPTGLWEAAWDDRAPVVIDYPAVNRRTDAQP